MNWARRFDLVSLAILLGMLTLVVLLLEECGALDTALSWLP